MIYTRTIQFANSTDMKKIILILIMVLPMVCFAQDEYAIEVTVKDINPAAKAYLFVQQGGKMNKDSARLEKGQFHFKGIAQSPTKAFVMLSHTGLSIYSAPNPDQVAVYLEPGRILVNAPDSLKHAVVGGTTLNNDQQELIDMLLTFKKREDVLNQEFKQAGEDKSLQEKVRLRYEQLLKERKQAQEAFIRSHPNSLVAFALFRSSIDLATEQAKAIELFNLFSASLKNTNAGQMIRERIAKTKPVELGSLAPLFSAKNTKGEVISLDSFKGKYVLVDFWASWCAPCRQESPNLVAAYKRYREHNFTILGVSLDGGENAKKKWMDAIEKDKLPWEQVCELEGWQSAIARMYSVSAIPANFLVDPDGKIIAMNLRGDALNEKLLSLFKLKSSTK